MLRWYLNRVINRQERVLGAPMDYARHILKTSRAAFLKFALFTPLAAHRRALPADAHHVARLTAVLHEDCGTCVQIECNLGRTARVDQALTEAVLKGRAADLPEPLRTVHDFTDRVVRSTYDEGELREAIRKAYGEKALVELALAIAAARVFPTAKRALGYAASCSLPPAQ